MKVRYYLRKAGTTRVKDCRFSRIIYYDTSVEPKNRIYLIVYLGDESIYDPKEVTAKSLTKTQPKTLEEIKSKFNENPKKLYSDLISKSTY